MARLARINWQTVLVIILLVLTLAVMLAPER